MKYKEFREYLKINEIHTQEDKERIIAAYQYEISKIEERSIIFLISLVDFPRDFQLLKKAIELAETPLDEREGEKKYYIKFTKAEIEALKAKFNTDLKDFEMIEGED